MAFPDGGVITETNQQYYAGAQGFTVADPAGESTWTFTFDTDLILGCWDPTAVDYALNNFKLYTSPDGINYTEYITEFTLVGNTITLGTLAVPILLPVNNVVVVQLKMLDGGNYGLRDAFGNTTEQNYGEGFPQVI